MKTKKQASALEERKEGRWRGGHLKVKREGGRERDSRRGGIEKKREFKGVLSRFLWVFRRELMLSSFLLSFLVEISLSFSTSLVFFFPSFFLSSSFSLSFSPSCVSLEDGERETVKQSTVKGKKDCFFLFFFLSLNLFFFLMERRRVTSSRHLFVAIYPHRCLYVSM